MTKSFKKVSALLLGLTMLGGVFGGALLARDPGGVVNAADGDIYEVVTSESELAAGDTVIIVSNPSSASTAKQIMANQGNTNYRYRVQLPSANLTGSGAGMQITWFDGNGGLTAEDAAVGTHLVEFTLGGSSGAWTFQDTETDQYLRLNSSGNNLQSGETANWTISFNSVTAEISPTAYTDRFINYNAGSPRFACYRESSNQVDISLFKKQVEVTTEPTATISGSASGVVGDTIELTANLRNFTETELLYEWSVAEGSENLVSIANGETLTASVTLLEAGNATINFIAMGNEEMAEASITINIQDVLTVKEAKELADGETPYVRGIVYAQYGDSFYIADEDGTGMQLFTYSVLGIAVGEEVVVTGEMDTYNEGRQLAQPVIISNEPTEKTVTPKVVTFDELNNSLINDFIAVENMVWHSGAASEINIRFHEEGDSAKELVLYNHKSNSAAYAGALTTAMADWEADVTTVTLAGVYGVYKTTLEIFLTSVTTYEIDAVDTFARKFLATELCDNGVTEPDTALWAGLKTEFDALDAEEQTVLREATGNEQGNVVEQAMRRYDYIIEKYGADRYENFIAREITPASNVVDNFFGSNDNLTIILVVTITLVSLSILIGFRFYLNKRKSNK